MGWLSLKFVEPRKPLEALPAGAVKLQVCMTMTI